MAWRPAAPGCRSVRASCSSLPAVCGSGDARAGPGGGKDGGLRGETSRVLIVGMYAQQTVYLPPPVQAWAQVRRTGHQLPVNDERERS